MLEQAKKLAEENYSTWGQWVIECMTDDELKEELKDFSSIEEWVDIRKRVAAHYSEIVKDDLVILVKEIL